MTETQSMPVIIQELPTACGRYIGQITLNNPKALNALNLDMAALMLETLQKWQSRSDLLLVVIDGEGEKAFCAGGDIVSMFQAMTKKQGKDPDFISRFFTIEYELDYLIHTYDKPVMVWGSGIVMGGGMGLLAGASHRVVTETSRLAMPEISIGLYPDVGASFFLPRLKESIGLFLGLTGVPLNATDALSAGLADYVCEDKVCQQLISELQDEHWDISSVGSTLDRLIETHQPQSRPGSDLQSWIEQIRQACNKKDAANVVESIVALDAQDSKWMVRAQKNLKQGSPISANVFFSSYQRGASLTLAQCFRMELGLSCRCGEYGEFQEGVRARLIDKDGAPRWKYTSVSEVPQGVIEYFFSSPWGADDHPLATLGE